MIRAGVFDKKYRIIHLLSLRDYYVARGFRMTFAFTLRTITRVFVEDHSYDHSYRPYKPSGILIGTVVSVCSDLADRRPANADSGSRENKEKGFHSRMVESFLLFSKRKEQDRY